MRLRQLFEAKQTVGFIFGRFNPPHKGHRAAWEMLSKNDAWYVGTNKSTQGPKDPLPYDIKIKAMEAIWPEVADHIIPHQSWLTLASEIYKKHGDVELNVYTDEEWVLKALNSYNGVEGKSHGFYNFPKINSVPTPRLSSATALRAAVAADDRDAFEKAAGVPADTSVDGKPFFDLVAEYLGQYKKESIKAEADNSVATEWMQKHDPYIEFHIDAANNALKAGNIEQRDLHKDLAKAHRRAQIQWEMNTNDGKAETMSLKAIKASRANGADIAEDASPEEEDDFHKKLDKLVHKTFGHSSDEKKMKKKKK